MMSWCFDVCLLIMETSAALSEKNIIRLSTMGDPQAWTAMTIGKSSKKAMLNVFHISGQRPCSQWQPKTAPNPIEPAASVLRWRVSEVTQTSLKKKDLPLNSSKNRSQSKISNLAPFERRMWWCGFWMPLVRSIKRRRKAQPGATTMHVKFTKPIKDWSSFRVTVGRV